MKTLMKGLMFAAALLLAGSTAQAAIDPAKAQKLLAVDAAADAQTGSSVAVDGDTAVIGAAYADTGGLTDAGTAYVFTRTGGIWTKQQKLTASDGAMYDHFGRSVAVDGDTLLIGADLAAPGGLAAAGAVYVFTRAGGIWTEQQKLTASDAAEGECFGGSVSVDGDTAVIGAWRAAPGGLAAAGAAYVFARAGGIWTKRQKLTASDAAALDRFGHSVSVSGDTAVIGAVHVDERNMSAVTGAAYVFTCVRGIWTEKQKLTASDAAANDWFGCSVSIDGDTTAVGGHAGAYMFTRASGIWTEQQKLMASDAAADDFFGISVSLSGDTAVIGACYAAPGGILQAGAAYVFARSDASWMQQAKLTAADGAAADRFGISVAVSDDTAVVSADGADIRGLPNVGAAYVFSGAPATNRINMTPVYKLLLKR